MVAQLILDAYERMGHHVFVPSVRDFSAGLEFIQEQAKGKKMVFLAANLMDEKSGKLLFERYKIFKRDGATIGITAVVTQDFNRLRKNQTVKDLKILDPVQQVQAVVDDIRSKVDVLAVIASLKSDEVTRLTQEVKGIDVLFLSHEQSGYSRHQPIKDEIPTISASSRGRQVGDLTMIMREKGSPFTSGDQKKNIQTQIDRLNRNIESRSKNLAAITDEKALERGNKMIESFQKQLEKAKADLAGIQEGVNTFSYDLVSLSKSIPLDPEIEQLVEKVKKEAGFPPEVNQEQASRKKPGADDKLLNIADPLRRPIGERNIKVVKKKPEAEDDDPAENTDSETTAKEK